MAIGAVMIVTIFVGVNITTWTSWVWWTLGIEVLLIWVYTVRGADLVCVALISRYH